MLSQKGIRFAFGSWLGVHIPTRCLRVGESLRISLLEHREFPIEIVPRYSDYQSIQIVFIFDDYVAHHAGPVRQPSTIQAEVQQRQWFAVSAAEVFGPGRPVREVRRFKS